MLTDREIELITASMDKGQEVMDKYFEVTKDVLKKSDMEIYNDAVALTGYNPVYTEVAMYLLSYIGVLRHIYSNHNLLMTVKRLEKGRKK